MSDSFATPWIVACQAPLSMRFPKQEYWGGLPFPFPGYLPDPGIEPSPQHCRQTLYCLSHLVAQIVKRLPTVRENWVQSLCWEDPLEEEMATHPSILAWKIPWAEEPGGLQSMGSQRVGPD